jgi:D-serine dehydratase
MASAAETMARLAGMPEVRLLMSRTPLFWVNRSIRRAQDALPALPLGLADIMDAEARLARFAPLLSGVFEDTRAAGGIIESALMRVPRFQQEMRSRFGLDLPGGLWVKADHALPVAGSIKARGGIYEVLVLAESIAFKHGLLRADEPYTRLLAPDARALFGKHTIAVASTGNLGLSVGVMGAALGFKTRVHMSVQAKPWKKERLRRRGVTVVEHPADVTEAARLGRQMAAQDPLAHFVDDENSPQLFLGYSVAALRLKKQLPEAGVQVDAGHPLFVYLPCGLGGAPCGITFGLKHAFGDAVRCFLAEPLEAPCVLLGMLTGFEVPVSVYDIGLRNETEADGLAVATPSRFIGPFAMALVSGCYTVSDEDLFRFVYLLDRAEGMRVEPSAAAGVAGLLRLLMEEPGRSYASAPDLSPHMGRANHIIWTTGGSAVPAEEYEKMRARGAALFA